ncbi:MAG: hypothetical protein D6B27_01415 [Gammaproteobacteria bacterium]|nr:MAG: hypothetical protein D6B27_01415 [Gammaproteobacteria bacterium]
MTTNIDNCKTLATVVSQGINSPLGKNCEITFARYSSCLANFSELQINENATVLISNIDDKNLFNLPENEKITLLHPRNRKLLQIAVPALQDCLKHLSDNDKKSFGIPLFLGLPQEQSIAASQEHQVLPAWIANISQIGIDITQSKTFSCGRASGIIAIEQAIKYLNESGKKFALVGACDSMTDLGLLNGFDSEKRLISPKNSEGFIAGEAAVFFLITTAPIDDNAKITNFKAVICGEESAKRITFIDSAPLTLANMVAELIEECGIENMKINTAYPSHNGEKEWLYEWGWCNHINRNHINTSECQLELPTTFFGDTGAADGLLKTAIAADAIKKGVLKTPVLIASSSDYTHRGAMLIS